MKNISIITGSDLRMPMGVNYFIKSFIQCNDYFKDVKLNRVYSGVQTLKIDEGDKIPIGSDIGTTEYKLRRCVRTFLRKLLTDRFYPFALLKYEANLRSVSMRSVERFFKEKPNCDYIIFQELGVAYYYFKHIKKHPEFKRIKTMLIIHNEDDMGRMWIDNFKGYGRRDMQRRRYKRRDYIYKYIDTVMYISRKAYEQSIMPKNKRSFVYNGSPNLEFSSKERTNNLTQFVCVGSIAGRKGQDKTLEAMHLMDKSYLNRMHFTIVGGGTKEAETKKMASDFGLDDFVTFTGIRNDVSDILKGMDVFIMPSTFEGLPMSAIEAMRAGLFLILTDTGGNIELCEKDCGVICTREPEDISKKMCKVIDCIEEIHKNRELRYNRFVANFSTRSMAEGYEKTLIAL